MSQPTVALCDPQNESYPHFGVLKALSNLALTLSASPASLISHCTLNNKPSASLGPRGSRSASELFSRPGSRSCRKRSPFLCSSGLSPPLVRGWPFLQRARQQTFQASAHTVCCTLPLPARPCSKATVFMSTKTYVAYMFHVSQNSLWLIFLVSNLQIKKFFLARRPQKRGWLGWFLHIVRSPLLYVVSSLKAEIGSFSSVSQHLLSEWINSLSIDWEHVWGGHSHSLLQRSSQKQPGRKMAPLLPPPSTLLLMPPIGQRQQGGC